MTLTRRSWLLRQAWALGLPLGACASGGRPEADTLTDNTTDTITDSRSGRRLTTADVARRMAAADAVLLGELHDNPLHHQRRAQLLAGLPMPVPVVAEHLPLGARPQLVAGASDEALRQVLEASGFDATGWQWPLHAPLFAALARAGHALHGGNLPRELARRVAREGGAALPANLRSLVEAAPLPGPASQALADALQQGHCGQLPAQRLPNMVWAQRGRDAAMASVLAGLMAPGRPALLLAGNGHVRRDHGVPQLLASLRPGARLLCIGFSEAAPAAAAPGPEPTPLYDIVWATPARNREDPCAGFSMPGPARR